MSRRPGHRWVRGLLGALAAGFVASAAAPASAAGTATPVARTPVKHLVVMVQDHRSFDSYLGSRPGLGDVPASTCQPMTTEAPTPCIKPFPLEASTAVPRLNPSRGVQRRQIRDGRMDGFVSAYEHGGIDSRAVMGYYRPSDLPVLTQLANEYTVYDRWFSSAPAGTVANRMFLMAAAPSRAEDKVPAAGWGDIPTVFDRLQAAGVPWRIYVEDYEPALTVRSADERQRRGGQLARVPVLSMPGFLDDPARMRNVVDLDSYYADAADGRLPAVSFVVTTRSSEHPPASPDAGQRVVRNVVNALGQSGEWSQSALLLTYDSSGGFYDHVPPSTVAGEQLGLRVPTLLVSPYVRAGSVQHAPMDHSSIPRFIEQNWGLAALTARDASAGDLATAFDFRSAPRRPVVIGPAGSRSVVRSTRSAPIYLLYGAAVLTLPLSAILARTPKPGSAGARRIRRRVPPLVRRRRTS